MGATVSTEPDWEVMVPTPSSDRANGVAMKLLPLAKLMVKTPEGVATPAWMGCARTPARPRITRVEVRLRFMDLVFPFG